MCIRQTNLNSFIIMLYCDNVTQIIICIYTFQIIIFKIWFIDKTKNIFTGKHKQIHKTINILTNFKTNTC